MDFSNIFRIANLAIGVIMVLGAVGKIIHNPGFQTIIEAVYIIIFGLATAGLEFQNPPQVRRYASFMYSFLGRGAFYIFVGSILFDNVWTGYASGSIVVAAGIAYVVLEFMPQIEPPANMQDPDVGWGAEQV